jgi:CheY-like chemotaxis protein
MVARILALLEHPEHLKQVSDSLAYFGHRVYAADKFQSAMDILRDNHIDLIICDVHLQNGGSVFDFLRWVQGDPLMRNIPFVCFSAQASELAKYVSDGVRTAARLLGAARYITMEKFDEIEFRQEIEWLLPKDGVGNYLAQHESIESDARPNGNEAGKSVVKHSS